MTSTNATPVGPVVNDSIATLARIAYVIVVLLATLAGLGFDPDLSVAAERLARAFDLTLHLRDAVDGVRNIVLFAGLGAVWVATSQGEHVIRSTVRVTVIGCGLSAFVETLQLFSPVRHASLLDVTTNTLGTLAGALMLDAIIGWMRSDRDRPSFIGIPAIIFAVAYGISVLAESFMPLFRQTLALPNLGGGVADRVGRALAAMRLSSIADIPIIDFALFLPAGAFAIAALIEFGVEDRVAWWSVAVMGMLLCAFMEVFHGVAYLPIQLGAIVTHTVAIAAGASLALRWLPFLMTRWIGTRRPRVVFIAYCALVVLWSWRPFIPELSAASIHEQFSAIHWVPLRALAIRFDLFTVTDVVTQFLLYVPLGALLTVWPLRTRGAWGHILPAVYLSIVMELGKIIVAQRFFDVTHILIQVAGAAMGWSILRHAGYAAAGEVWGDENVSEATLVA